MVAMGRGQRVGEGLGLGAAAVVAVALVSNVETMGGAPSSFLTAGAMIIIGTFEGAIVG